MPFFSSDLHPQNNDIDLGLIDVPRVLTAFGGVTETKGTEVSVHQHDRGQLILTMRGVVRCEADQGVWIVPARCALWIPPEVPHCAVMEGKVEIYSLLIDHEASLALPTHCCAVSASQLLQGLIIHAVHMPTMYDVNGPDGRIAVVLLDQLALAPIEKLNFPMPRTPKLREIAAALIADPADRATIEEWARRKAIAPRTLTRALMSETGMSFGRWRQQLHVLIALERLDQGQSTDAVANDLGYRSSSAFTSMFRKALGKPPMRYLSELAK